MVLFIISIMMGLLFPALQAARHRALTTQCQNNLRQVGMAVGSYINSARKFPSPNHWTIDCLKWMEEWPLADALANGIPKNTELPRPRLFRCPAQADPDSTTSGVAICHYVFVIDRSNPSRPRGWDLNDRQALSEWGNYDPWYIGPEMSYDEQKEMFANKSGPHPGGLFYDANGQTRGGD